MKPLKQFASALYVVSTVVLLCFICTFGSNGWVFSLEKETLFQFLPDVMLFVCVDWGWTGFKKCIYAMDCDMLNSKCIPLLYEINPTRY